MNTKSIVLTCFLLFALVKLTGQSIGFSYDANGNRVSRVLVVEQLKSGSAITESILENDLVDLLQKPEDTDEFPEVHVYPNPTKGLLQVEIDNVNSGSLREMRIYDLSGREVLVKKNFENNSECDLNSLQDGIYILRIKIDDKAFNWKVIKNHY